MTDTPTRIPTRAIQPLDDLRSLAAWLVAASAGRELTDRLEQIADDLASDIAEQVKTINDLDEEIDHLRSELFVAPCADCGTNTTSSGEGCYEGFMVHDHVWAQAWGGSAPPETHETEWYLCVACLEARLGRALTAADFTDAPINEPDESDTPRLAAAKVRKP